MLVGWDCSDMIFERVACWGQGTRQYQTLYPSTRSRLVKTRGVTFVNDAFSEVEVTSQRRRSPQSSRRSVTTGFTRISHRRLHEDQSPQASRESCLDVSERHCEPVGKVKCC
jgi:hypothetical protein